VGKQRDDDASVVDAELFCIMTKVTSLFVFFLFDMTCFNKLG